ncbi:FecR family protein [Lacibacter cauensis]|uniref:FecR family protein n=1 Tax=Lacibacter cauensis TaxID=510947 RepID=A0A562SRL2_9BACT|nr:FecR family protein [Lacibacter cauensis]TWI83897.1 FecR family protein [Lacibacter cauensis]
MSQEQYWILLSKKIAGEASPEELTELEQLMQQHPEWQYAAQNLADIWASEKDTNTADEEDAYLLHVQRMKEQGVGFEDNVLYAYPQAEQPRTSHFAAYRKIYISIAVAASILTAVFVFSSQLKSGSKVVAVKEPNEITTNNGSRTKVQLPDGSVVWLNAGSKIKYDENFGTQTRDVILSGEAFFDVVKNKEKPFVIHTPTIDIKVVGTAFNVKAYPKDPTTETSLIRGLIEVTIKNRSNDKIILTPNEKLIVENNPAGNRENASTGKPEPVISINPIKPNRNDSTINEIQWVQNRLVFDDEPLQEIARKMERWYNVTINIQTEELLDKRISGSFVNENIDQALEALSITGRFRYKRTNNTITINP